MQLIISLTAQPCARARNAFRNSVYVKKDRKEKKKTFQTVSQGLSVQCLFLERGRED